jgi:DNA topoisomerase-6 subunit B
MKDAQNRLNLYKHYIPLIIGAITESIKVDPDKLTESFNVLAEKHVKGEVTGSAVSAEKQDKITSERIEEQAEESNEQKEEMTDVAVAAATAAARAKGKAEKRTTSSVPESLKKTKDDQKTLDEVIDKKGRRRK